MGQDVRKCPAVHVGIAPGVSPFPKAVTKPHFLNRYWRARAQFPVPAASTAGRVGRRFLPESRLTNGRRGLTAPLQLHGDSYTFIDCPRLGGIRS